MSEFANNFLEPESPRITETSWLVEGDLSAKKRHGNVKSILGSHALALNTETQDTPGNSDELWDEKVAGIVLSDDPIKDYLRQIGGEPLLNALEEVELSMSIEVGLLARDRFDSIKGDPQTTPKDLRELLELERIGNKAKDRMINANLRLVVNIAKRFQGKGLSFQEVIQEGNLGMIRAVEKFDYAKGFKFSTYATWWIRQAIQRSLADTGREIRVPVHVHEDIGKVFKIERGMFIKLGREPTDEEVVSEAGITLEQLHNFRRYSSEALSLNKKIGDDQTAEIGDLIEDTVRPSPEDTIDTLGLNQRIQVLLATLPEKEAFVLRRRMGIATGEVVSLEELGRTLNLTREGVRQIEFRALQKFRGTPGLLDELREYL